MARDTQKQRVYDWENALFNRLEESNPELSVELPLEVCQSFVNKICAAYGVAAPVCVLHRLKYGNTAHYTHWKRRITLPDNWARCARIVAHETAHCITDSLFGYASESHGAEFVRVFSDIISKFLGIDAVYVDRFVRVAHLKQLSMSPIPGVYKCH